jgi:hypothetical protein
MEAMPGVLAWSAQKEVERQHLHSFRGLCPGFPAGNLTEGETPDFVVTTPSGWRIGIEHTQVFKQPGADGTPEQADEATKNFITMAAKQHAEALGLPPVRVTLFFNPHYLRRSVGNRRQSLTKAERQSVAEKIAAFVAAKMPDEGGFVECDWRPGQPRQVDLIHIDRQQRRGRHVWWCLEMNAIQSDAIERFQEAITKKDKNYETCISECDECWLLVVANSFQSSGTIHQDSASILQTYTSPFTRVYFLDFGLGKVHRLNVASGS